MVASRGIWLACLLAVGSFAQSTSSATSTSDSSSDTSSTSSTGSSTGSATGSSTGSSSSPSIVTLSGTAEVPTGNYGSIGAQSTATALYGTSTSLSGSSSTGTATGTSSTLTTTSKGSTSTVTRLVGGAGIQTLSVINGTVTLTATSNSTTSSTASSSSTSTAAAATNTQACNNYPEFCSRKYSNITEVCAHNSAFTKPNNAASNQALSITDQLDDGIRMIQGETHYVNDTIYSCHTSCDLLNAGTLLSELKTVAAWVESHPYDVVTILLVNSDYVAVGNYTAPLQDSGLGPYLYEPPYIPMKLDQWPTLSEMILSQKRVVVFMDYNANQAEVPYILDEFTQMWETPFSPTDDNFPCTTQRPPNLNQTVARDDLLYLANHNLNTDVSIFGSSLLIPNTADINNTNSAGDQVGQLGATAANCTADWGRPPNFLLVDYYNMGSGSVFEVAAKYNNVTYNRKCCGIASTSAASGLKSSAAALVMALVAAFVFVV